MNLAATRFWTSLLTSASLMAVIVVLPKDPASGDLVRLGMTLTFLLAALSLVWCFLDPLDAYLAERWTAMYEGAGAAVGHTVSLLRVNVMAPVRLAAWLGMSAVAFVSLDVLQAWPPFDALRAFGNLYAWGWGLSLLGVLALPLIEGRQVSQAWNLSRQLREQVASVGFVPGQPRHVSSEAEAAVEILDGSRFKAGSFAWDWSDFHKNVVVFGQPGSGKTVCVLNPLLEGLVSCGSTSNASAGLILDPKGDFRDKIARLMDRAGRSADLLVFDPDDPGSMQWNPFDTPDSVEEVANRFGAVFALQNQGGDKDAFFIQHSKQFLEATLTLFRIANPPGQPPSTTQLADVMGDSDALEALVAKAFDADVDPITERWRVAALRYLRGTWTAMAPETLSGVTSTLSTILSPFNNPPFDELMGRSSSISLGQVIDSGRVLYVHFPIAKRPLMAQVVGTLLKVEFRRQVLLRKRKKRPSFFFCDEFQVFLTTDKETADADFFGLSRESNHANVVATQTRPALLQRSKEPHPIDHLLGCCATKVFLRNTNPETNEWASKLFGERLDTIVSTSRNAGTLHPSGHGGGGLSTSSTTNMARAVRPEAFTALAQPSIPESVRYAESIVHFTARAAEEKLLLRWPVHPL